MTRKEDEDALAETAAGSAPTPSGATPIALDETATDSTHFPAAGIPPGTKIGRFVVVEKLGEGGMGVVVAAYDPQLDRRVAIKMVRGEVSEAQRARLEREARAMAQLSHPNVVAVHETGMFDGQLYIAMEYVEGQTFGRWLRAAPRSRDEILDRMMQAGRGLAAAHAVGLVHRDFKPDNVLVGKDGRVRVSDFGLVSSAADRASSDAQVTLKDAAPARPSTLTQTGAVMGTPLYMAPEQHDGRVADPKADQFGFCVTAWQAICDELPYGADSYEDLVANVTGGKLRAPPRSANVPAKLRAILARGLSSDPRARFPSMDALLAAIERVRRPARWPWWVGGGVALTGGAAALAVTLAGRGAPADPCTGGPARVAAVWDSARKAKLAAAMHATGAPAVDDVASQIEKALDGYASAWAAHHREVCLATSARGEQSPELLDLRMHCLDRQLGEVSAKISRFTETKTRDDVFHALDAVSQLPDVADCDDADRLRAGIPLPRDPAARARIGELEARAAEVKAYDDLSQFGKARALLEPLLVDVRAIGYAPLDAELTLLRAAGEYRDGKLALAEQHYREAAEVAARARDDERIAQAWSDLISVYGASGKYADAIALEPIARTATERVSDKPLLVARFHNAVGGIYLAQQRYPEAKAEYAKALDVVRRLPATNNLLGPALTNLAIVLPYVGDSDGAAKMLEEARAWFVARKQLGYASLGYVDRNIGDLALARGAVDDAIAHYTSALEVFETASGREHVDVANALEPLAGAYVRKGDLPKAHELYERALQLRIARLGADHPSVASTLIALADADMAEGTVDSVHRALDRLDRSLAIQTKAFGDDYARLPETLERIARGQLMLQSYDAAIATYTRDLDVRSKTTTGLHGDEAARVYVSRGGTHALLHHRELAVADYDHGVRAATTPDTQALLGYVAARGLWGLGKHAEAIAAGKQARAVAPASNAQLAAAIDAWLARPGA